MDPVSVPARERSLIGTLSELLAPDRPGDWERGFAVARQLGRAGLPLLVDLAERESADVRRRILFAVAASVGAGPAADDFLLAVAASRDRSGGANLEERVAMCLTIGFGGPREGAALPLAELAARRGLQPLEEVAIAAAIARHPDAPGPPDRWYQAADPAVVAAAAFARPPRDPAWIAAWLQREQRHADLVRRGALLGAGPAEFDAELAARLRGWLQRGGEDAQNLRLAVGAWLARAAEPAAWIDRGRIPLHEELLPVLAAEPTFRAELLQRGLLGPPSPRLPPDGRRRIAVAFALETDVAAFRATAAAWARDDATAAPLCLGLAWRFLHTPPDQPAPWLEVLPDVREAEWVRLACGVEPRAPSRSMPDARLDRAFLLAVADGARLPRAARIAELEDALWRAGAHPGASRHEIELDLLRDLALSGSTHGTAVQGLDADPRARHLPRGASAGAPVFEILYAAYREFRSGGPRRPDPVRLR